MGNTSPCNAGEVRFVVGRKGPTEQVWRLGIATQHLHGGEKEAAVAGAVTPGEVRCSAWLGDLEQLKNVLKGESASNVLVLVRDFIESF